MRRVVNVVPHTHWDREWYEPFPAFRLRLVGLLDGLLPLLEDDPGFTHFQLDGQMAVVDDYLEIRPENGERIRSLAQAGRLSMGPWYVLPDEFLVSGETHIRNLQLGLGRAEDFGGAMQIGYLPDMFGHVAQMPQLLSLFGFAHAVVWRGVPSELHGPAFTWQSPDGSTVRAEYLPSGYFNGSAPPRDPARLKERIDMFIMFQDGYIGERILWMAGMDHEVPPAHLSSVVAELNATSTEFELTIGSLAEYLAEVPSEHLPTLNGELRSGHRSNLLMGVTSNCVDVKQAAARAERSLEREAEPMAALWLGDAYSWQPLLNSAWKDVIRNAAHDSICACSHDDVVTAVLLRYADSTTVADGITAKAQLAAASQMSSSGTFVLNPTARDRTGVVTVDVVGEHTDSPTLQVLSQRRAVEELHRTGAIDAPMVVAREMLAEHPDTAGVRFVEEGPDDAGRPVLTVHLLPKRLVTDDSLPLAEALALLGNICSEQSEIVVCTVVHREEPSATALAVANSVPGFGWARWTPSPANNPVARFGEFGLTNEMVTVVVDPADGTFTLNGVAGCGRLVDQGDAGDSYNWCPPDEDLIVDQPTAVVIDVTESGPLRGRIVIDRSYELPEFAELRPDGNYRRGPVATQRIRTIVEVLADDDAVRLTVEMDHHIRDHRLRMHLPLPQRANRSRAECAFAIVERPLWAEGGPNEWGVPTFPSRRFVEAGGMTVTHEGLCEYELVALDGEPEDPGTTSGELALTLVRATGWLSRGPMASRPLPAGPELRLTGTQSQGPLRLRLALSTTAADPYELADRVWTPLMVTEAPGGGLLPDGGTHLNIDGGVVDSITVNESGNIVVRVHEPDGVAGEVRLPGRSGSVIDLQGQVLGPFEESAELRPHQILTICLNN